MKKVFSIFMTMLFVSTFSFANNAEEENLGCTQYAFDAVLAEQLYFEVAYSHYDWLTAVIDYQDECISVGGPDNMMDQIFM